MMILSLDYGERYVGVAITDPEGTIALRHSVIDQKEFDVMSVVPALIESEDVEKVLVGVPVSLSGRSTAQTEVSLKFIEKLAAGLPKNVKIEEVDETLTSVEAKANIVAEGGNTEDEHMEAARIMLADFLLR